MRLIGPNARFACRHHDITVAIACTWTPVWGSKSSSSPQISIPARIFDIPYSTIEYPTTVDRVQRSAQLSSTGQDAPVVPSGIDPPSRYLVDAALLYCWQKKSRAPCSHAALVERYGLPWPPMASQGLFPSSQMTFITYCRYCSFVNRHPTVPPLTWPK